MPSEPPREWLRPSSLEEAARVQKLLAAKVVVEDRLGPVRRLGGTDVSNDPHDPESRLHAVVVALDAGTLRVVETASASAAAPIPYVPGFLGFREAPALVEAFRALREPPDLVFVDGHGVSHPRGLGIASHLGVLLDVPTIGVAKRILVGRPQGELGPAPGDRVPLVWRGKTLGAVVRTRANVQPVYVSAGHRVSLETAVEWVTRCMTGLKLPEPTRRAHEAANAVRKAARAA